MTHSPSLLPFQSNVAASNAKLALFYDWLFFNPDKDSIMNIGTLLTHLFSGVGLVGFNGLRQPRERREF